MIRISSGFDGGNIRCLSMEDPSQIQLEIAKDFQSHHFQWFYFRLTGAKAQPCKLHIVNAGAVAYPKGFEGYQTVASYDRESWFRVPTQFENGILTMEMTPETDSVYFAYFAPYSMERHHDLIAEAGCHDSVSIVNLGETLDGQDLELLQVGAPAEGKLRCWFIARQHPGETMAEWFMEGLLDRLLDGDDPISQALLDQAVFYLVPNMNPDGSRRGHLRTNASGTNLNREWYNPSMARSPEVYLVREQMIARGVDFCLDVHGDEALPYNFIAGSEGIADWSASRLALQDDFKAAFVEASPDFQTKYGYPISPPKQSNLAKATDYIAQTFGCLAMTLEMPFKDSQITPNPEFGWSPNRCKHLSGGVMRALLKMMPRLSA